MNSSTSDGSLLKLNSCSQINTKAVTVSVGCVLLISYVRVHAHNQNLGAVYVGEETEPRRCDTVVLCGSRISVTDTVCTVRCKSHLAGEAASEKHIAIGDFRLHERLEFF